MSTLIISTYALILILGVSISGYLSYEGLLRTAGEITLPLVILLMAIIFVMDATISYFRTTERSYRLPLFIWAVAAFFSIASNFNFLYSNFMREDVTKDTVTEQLAIFRDDLVDTKSNLAELDLVKRSDEVESDLLVELRSLKDQINDPLRPGCGQECRAHMAEIERILGREITNLAVPGIGSRMEVVNDWYVRYGNSAKEMLLVSQQDSGVTDIRGLMRDIDNHLEAFDSPERVLSSKGGLEALADMSTISLDVERRANSFTTTDRYVDHAYIDPSLGRLGEIVYSFENGFNDMPNPIATFGALVLASVVDILPLLLSFALFGRGRLEKEAKPNRNSRDPSGRRIVG